MNYSKIERTIAKYLTNSISSQELDNLASWLEENEYYGTFKSFLRINYVMSYTMGQYNSEKAKEHLLKTIRKDKSTYNNLRISKFLKYAAIALVFMGIGLLYREMVIPGEEKGIATIDAKNNVTLRLSDGSVKLLTGQGTVSILDNSGYRIGLQNGGQLIYHQSSTGKKLTFNTLKVPFGKRFKVILSDGTKVNLNAGTMLRYPVEFIKGKKRQVFLDGEAFFDVAKDKEHPFVVNTSEMRVGVLGTRFNLSAYSVDAEINTVLVEGSVSLYGKDKTFDLDADKILEPGFMATWQKDNTSIDVKKVDPDLYTGWMDGKIVFNHIPFKDILKKLERNYQVKIENKNKALDDVRFTASFDTETIGQILESFKKGYPIVYKIVDQEHIIIEQP